MLIEDINKRTLQIAKFWELSNLRFRAIQVYDRHIQKGAGDSICGMATDEFLNRYVQLRLEMAKRGLPINTEADIDLKVQDRIKKRAIWTIDVPGLSDITVTSDFVSLIGEFVRDPRGAGEVEMVAKAEDGTLSPEIERRIIKAVAREIGREGTFSYQPAGPGGTSLPLFDLVLRAKPQTKKATPAAPTGDNLEKAVLMATPTPADDSIGKAVGMAPTTSEEWHRVPVQPSDNKGTMRYFWISEEKGIKCLEDMSRKKVLAFLFAVDNFTLAEAVAWVKRYKEEKMQKASMMSTGIGSSQAMTAEDQAEDQAKYDAENVLIDANRKTMEARGSHKFARATFSYWGIGGKDRCLVCGAERPTGDTCPGTDAPYGTMAAFYQATPAPLLADIGKTADLEAFLATWNEGEAAAFFKTEDGALAFRDANPEAVGQEPREVMVDAETPLHIDETDLAKIETTAAFHRIPVLPAGKDTKIRTITISKEQGIFALYDIDNKQIVTYLFDCSCAKK